MTGAIRGRILPSRARRGAALLPALAAAALLAVPSRAASPPGATIVQPADPAPSASPKQTITYEGGRISTGTAGGAAEAFKCDPSECDSFKLKVTIPKAFWAERAGKIRIRIEWTEPAADVDLYIFDSTGRLVGASSGGTEQKFEEVTLVDPADETFSINALNFNPVELPGYSGRVEMFVEPIGIISEPADPAASTSPKQTVNYEGARIPTGNFGRTAQARQCDPDDCHSFRLKVGIPDAFWFERKGKVRIRVEWTATDADVDLFVFDSAERLIASSTEDNITMQQFFEQVDLADLGRGRYFVNALNFNSTELPGYTGRIELFVDEPMPPPSATVNSTSIRFTPATQVNPMSIGGEPAINFDRRPETAGRRIFIDWPTGDPVTQKGSLYRSEDGGNSFRRMEALPCAARGMHTPSCLQSGGGDTEVSLSPGSDIVYFSDQEILVQQALAVSPDAGVNWPPERQHAITNGATVVDRQWLAARSDPTLGEIAYLSYHVPAVGEYVQVVLDGGLAVAPQPAPQVLGVAQSGPMVVDNTGGAHDGTIYFPYAFFDEETNLHLAVAVSTDGAVTFATYPVSPAEHVVDGINWMAMDEAGNVFVAYLETQSADVYIATMKADASANAANPGSTWSTPVRVSAPPAATTVFPAIAAGSPGRAAVAYYGTTAPTVPDLVRPDAPWQVYVAMSDDALCQWDSPPCASPRFRQAVVSQRVAHVGDACTGGAAISIPEPAAAGDPEGDATWPPNGPLAPGTNRPSLDLLGTRVERTEDTLTVVLALKDASDLDAGLKGTGRYNVDGTGGDAVRAMYMVTWYFGDHLYFAAAEYLHELGTDPKTTFSSGRLDSNSPIADPQGEKDDSNGIAVFYRKDHDARGSISGNETRIVVPLAEIGSPRAGDRLLSVTGAALTGHTPRTTGSTTVPNLIDAAPPFTYVLPAAITRPAPLPPTGGPAGLSAVGALLLVGSALIRGALSRSAPRAPRPLRALRRPLRGRRPRSRGR